MNRIFLLLGSNLGDRSNNLDCCLELLEQRTGCIVDTSSVYETEPWGTDIPLPYLNMVAVVENDKTPGEMLESILLVEKEMGRKRGPERNAPRTVDVDILLYNSEIIEQESLKIPHERMHLRKFVLVPMVEIAPELMHPLFAKTMHELLEECPDSSWVRIFKSRT